MNEIDDLLQRMPDADPRPVELGGSLRRASEYSPEEYAKAVRIAAQTGVVPKIAYRDKDMEHQAMLVGANPQRLVDNHPALAGWLTEDEANAILAQDDLDSLKAISEQSLAHVDGEVSAALPQSWMDKAKTVFRHAMEGTLFKSDEEAQAIRQAQSWRRQAERRLDLNPGEFNTGNAATLPAERVAVGFGRGIVSPIAGMASYGERKTGLDIGVGKTLKGLVNAMTPEDSTLADRSAEQAGALVGLLIPGMGASKAAGLLGKIPMLSRFPRAARYTQEVAGALGMAIPEAASEAESVYDQNVARGMSKEEAAKKADSVFLVNLALLTVTDKVGWFGKGGAMRRALSESIQEGGQQITSNLATDRPALEGVGESTATGFGVALVMPEAGGLLGSLFHNRGLGYKVSNPKPLVDAALASKLRERSPEKFQEFASKVLEGTPKESVYIDPEAFHTYFQGKGVDPEAVASILGAKNYDEAAASGTPLVIPAASYLTQLAQHHEALAQDVRFSLDEMTPRQAEAAIKQHQELVQQGMQQEAYVKADSVTIIQEGMQRQLESVGFEPSTAATYAELYAAPIANIAERMGMDPAALHERYGLTVDRPSLMESTTNGVKRLFQGVQKMLGSKGKMDQTLIEGQPVLDVNDPSNWDTIGRQLHEFIASRHKRTPDIGEVVTFIRYGSIVKESRNHADGILENGMSVYSLNSGGASEQPVRSEFSDRHEAYIGKGIVSGYGSDGEPLVRDITDVRKATKKDIDIAEYYGMGKKKWMEYIGFGPDGMGLRPKGIKDYTTLYQSVESEKRGFIQFSDGRKFSIGLLNHADLSTFVHETGHFYLEVVGDMAEAKEAPPQIKEDYAKILKFLGVESRDQLTAKHHEKFARANEAYLMEGKAPSTKLETAFARVKEWMKLVYTHLRNLGVRLNPEVRDVFDRIYASDEAIRQAKESVGDTSAFIASAEDVGWDSTTFEAYKKVAGQEIDTATKALEQRMVQQAKRQHEAWWREEAAKVREEVTYAIDERRDFKALRYLAEGLPDGTTIKLDKASIASRYGEETVKALPKKVFGKGGVDAEAAADLLGFESGDVFLEVMRTMPQRVEIIGRVTDELMRARHGDIRTDGTIADAAMDDIHNMAREKRLSMELAAARKMQRVLSAEASQQKANARAVVDDIPNLDSFRSAAGDIVGNQQIKDLQPSRYLDASRKASREAFEAMAKKDYETAASAKQKELLNHFLYRESRKIVEESESISKYARRIAEKPAQARLGKAGQSFQDQANAILERYEFVKVSNKALVERQSLGEWARVMDASGEEVVFSPEILQENRQLNYREVKIGELRAIRDALKNIETIARRQLEFDHEGKKVAFESAVEEMRSSAYANASAIRTKPLDPSMATAGESVRETLQGLDAGLKKVELLIDWMDGGDINGPWRKYIFDPIAKAQYREADMQASITAKLVEAMDRMPKEIRMNLTDGYSIPELDPSRPISRKMLLSMAFNMGNEVNQDKMLRGMGWTTKLDAVHKALANLTSHEWQFVQETWDIINSLWPEIADLENRMTGLAPVKVEPKGFSVETSDGKTMSLTGGYYPLVYDPSKSAQGAQQVDLSGQLMGEKGYTKATTSRGHTKERNEAFAAPVLLDFEQVLTRHTTRVIKDLTHREAALNAYKLISNQKVRTAIQETLGESYEKLFMPWLKNVVNSSNGGIDPSMSRWDSTMTSVRSNIVISALAFRAGSVIVQATDWIRAADRVKSRHLGQAILDFTAHPGKTIEFVRSLSKEMEHRPENLDRDLRARLNQITGKDGAYIAVQRFGMHGLAMADSITSVTTWLGAYRQALAEGSVQEDAIREADRTVRLTLMTGAPKDQVAFQRAQGWKMFTMFMGDSTAAYGILGDAWHKASGNKKHIPAQSARVLMRVMLPAIMAAMLKNRGPGDDEDKAWWATKQGLFALPATVPILRDVADIASNGRDAQFSPIAGAMAKAGKAAHAIGNADDEPADAFLKSADAFATFSGVPGWGQSMTTGRYLHKVLAGEETPENAWQFSKNTALGKNPKNQ